jgi:putative ABC transport system permease protein
MSKGFADMPRISELTFDWRALLFAAAVSILAATMFGIIPALQTTRTDLAPVLAESSRSVSAGRRSLQRGLVIAQLAVTVLLLASAGLLMRSYYNLSHVNAGFDTGNTIAFHVGAAWNEDRPQVGRLQMEILSQLQRFPGVEAAGTTSFFPATGATLNFQVTLEGIAQNDDNGLLTTGYRNVSSDYLRSLKIPLFAGRWCQATDPFDFRKPVPTTAMVNRRFAELYGKGQNLIGRHFHFAQSSAASVPVEIVGLVGDVKEDGLAAEPSPYIYECERPGSWPDPEYVARTNGDPRILLRQIPQIVHGIDANRAVFGVKLLDGLVDDSLEQPRLNARFIGVFAATAMLLASVGLYSLITLLVTARTREIGVRIALGANRGQIMAMVFAGAGWLLVAGILIGLGLTLAAERLIKSALFGVSPIDALTIGAAVALLAIVSIFAILFPARRAASIDPLDAIRAD